MRIEQLIRSHLLKFEPYRSARSEVRDARIFLDANELSSGSPVEVDGISLHRYPDPSQTALRGKIAEQLSLSPERIFVGVGSDEIIDLLIRLFCNPSKDSVGIFEPTYGVYRVAATVNDVEAVSLPLNECFHIDAEQSRGAASSSTKIIFCCSPNNPTGNLLDRNDILKLCRDLDTIVVVDQAYIEFADAGGDLSNDVLRNDNLVVLRTFSKAWGLAGIRLGYCIAHPAIVSYLLRIKAPYNINAVTSKLALEALKKKEFLVSSSENVVEQRNRLAAGLKRIAGVIRVYPSDANFLLVEVQHAARLYERLANDGIIVRRRSEPRLANCLRLTVGTQEENDLLLHSLSKNL